MELTQKTSKHNYLAFLWHATFLAFAKNFMDVDTVIPAMLVEAGGSAIHIGLITTIMLGGASFTQLFFAPVLSNYAFKKKALLFGINGRMLALFGLFLLMLYAKSLGNSITFILIFLLIAMYSVGGAFANISYTDILGKSVMVERRKSFFSIKQVIMGVGAFVSAFLVKKVLTSWAYPLNYAYMLLIGFFALSIASIAFWLIKEVIPSGMTIKNTRHFIEIAKKELKGNPRLKYFLGFVNTQGISIAFLPFAILYAKEVFQTEAADTGRFLIFKVIGGIVVSLVIFIIAQKVKYRYLLYGNAFLALSLPILVLVASGPSLLSLVFLFGGIVVSIHAIAMNGVLLEISGNENRTLYSGITGAGNIVPALFPILGGWIIQSFGFAPFFAIYAVILVLALFFIYKLDCLK